MTRRSFALLAALAALLVACGRKGSLEAPPDEGADMDESEESEE